jgi:hypothetical protein
MLKNSYRKSGNPFQEKGGKKISDTHVLAAV